jgi:hypothetical protein
MEEMVIIGENQKVTPEDFNNFGQYPRDSLDHAVHDGISPGKGYYGFNVVASAPAEVTVGSGRFYNGGVVFSRDDEGGFTIDMIDNLPAVAKRKALVVVWGITEETGVEPRTFLIDPETYQTQGQEVATVSRRTAQIDALYGVENATPQNPSVDANYLAVAELVLTPAGIEANSIKMLVGNKLPSGKDNADAITVINNRLSAIGPDLDTAKSNISGLAEGLRGKADRNFVTNVALEVARVKEKIGLPDDYVAFAVNHFVTEVEVDPAFSGYSAKVRDGWRFPNVASDDVAIALANALDPAVIVNDNMVLPAFTNVRRLSVTGKDGEYALADSTIETTTVKQMSRTRTVRKYFESEYFSANSEMWRAYVANGEKEFFERAGETFAVFKVSARGGKAGDYQATRYEDVTIEEPYFDSVLTSATYTGAQQGQTWLQGNDGYLTQIGLFFTRRASSGDVRILICETKANGSPDLERVVAQKVLLNADIVPLLDGSAETVVNFVPTPLLKGRRYTWVLISNAAHFHAIVKGNKLGSGTAWYSQDGTFIQRPIDEDLPFNLYFAEFAGSIVPVQLEALELAGGVDGIDVNADYTHYDGTALQFQVRVNGEWVTLG